MVAVIVIIFPSKQNASHLSGLGSVELRAVCCQQTKPAWGGGRGRGGGARKGERCLESLMLASVAASAVASAGCTLHWPECSNSSREGQTQIA